jgi:putative ABC transport system ATP-binding protein
VSIPSDNPILLARDLGPGEGAPAFSIAVGDGEIVALTGTASDVEASGPLLRRLAGADPAEGGLWLKGEPLHTFRPAARLRFSSTHCAVLPQAVKLLPEISVAENATMPLLLTGLGRQEARRRALCWLERLDVVTCADSRIRELSPGQLRRVAIARALVTEPTILLAEEPLAGLGRADRLHLMRIIRVAAGVHQLTVIVSTSEDDVAQWADRQVALPKAVPDDNAGAGATATAESGGTDGADETTKIDETVTTAEMAEMAEMATTSDAAIPGNSETSSLLGGFHSSRQRLAHGGRHRAGGRVGDRSGVGVGR